MEKNLQMMMTRMLMKMYRIMSLNAHKYSLMRFKIAHEERNYLILESYYYTFIVIPKGY